MDADSLAPFFFLLYISSGGWGKGKLEITTLPPSLAPFIPTPLSRRHALICRKCSPNIYLAGGNDCKDAEPLVPSPPLF